MSKIRNSNIELLRIISMFFIVMGHFCNQTNIFKESHGFNKFLIYILGNGARIAVNIFLLIAIWYMIDSKFNIVRVIRLYSELFFYTSIITLIMLALGYNSSLKDIMRGFFPFCGRALWFVSAYITLYLFTPFLNNFFDNKREFQFRFCVLSFIAVCGISTLPDLQEGYLIDSVWFLFMYIWTGYLKKYIWNNIKFNPIILILGGILIYMILIISNFISESSNSIMFCFLNSLSGQYIEDIKSFPNILCAVLIFLGVVNCGEKNSRIINVIAKSTLAVYIVHQVPVFINFLWFNIFKANLIITHRFSSIYLMSVALIIFIVITIVDSLRIKYIEKCYMQSSFINKVVAYFNKYK